MRKFLRQNRKWHNDSSSMRSAAENLLKTCGLCAFVVSALFAYPKAPRAIPLRGQAPAPDAIFIGQFLTLDRSHPQTEAIAVLGSRIVAMGSESEIEVLANKNTRRIHIEGVGLPGFADAHVHVEEVGAQLEKLNLRGLTKTAILAKVAEVAHSAPPGAWIIGEGWDEGFWQHAEFPSSKELDTVSGDHPVVLNRIDEHSIWVNSKVLTLAKISRDTRDPNGGMIRRNAANEPTGMLVDKAVDLIRRVTPKPSHADRERHIRIALQQFSKWGLTSVHDAGVGLDAIAIYKDLLKRGELPVRVYAMAAGNEAITHYLAAGPEFDFGNGMLAVRSFKLFLDGALGSRGAEMTEAYADAPSEHGLQLMKDADLERIVRAAREKGFQVNTHAIGDRAVNRALNAFEKGGVTREERFRVEHASIVTDDDVRRFVRLGIIASIQPVFVGEYSRWAEDRVGPSRARWVLRARNLLDAGVTLAAGTDYPASDSGMSIATLHCLVTRQSAEGKPEDGWHYDQGVDLDQALRMMTAGPAFAAFQEKDLGAFTVGRYADFTVVSANPYHVPSKDLRTITICMTVVAGRVTYDARRDQAAALRSLHTPQDGEQLSLP